MIHWIDIIVGFYDFLWKKIISGFVSNKILHFKLLKCETFFWDDHENFCSFVWQTDPCIVWDFLHIKIHNFFVPECQYVLAMQVDLAHVLNNEDLLMDFVNKLYISTVYATNQTINDKVN